MQPHVSLVFGTRPEAIKLFPLVYALRRSGHFRVSVWVTGQHRHLLDQVLSVAKITPDLDLNVMAPDQTLDALTSRLLLSLGEALDRERPDWVLVQGDTTTAMVASLAAHYRKISVGHVEAGLRTGNNYSPWPEEVNRRMISTIAKLHFAPTEWAADNLFRENIDRKSVHITGNTGIDALLFVYNRLKDLAFMTGTISKLLLSHQNKKIVLVTAHRRENFDSGLGGIAEALRVLAKRDDVLIVFPVHPNPRVTSTIRAELGGCPRILLLDPLDYVSFIYLMSISTLILTDSGGIQEEAASFGKPVLVLRDTTERPEGINAGISRLVGTHPQRIVREASLLLDDMGAYDLMSKAKNPYGDGRASERVSEILHASI